MRGFTGEFSSKTVGLEYEKKAAAYLLQQGYKILQRNYRCKMGEIDIIARDGEYLCFIEVKYRKTEKFQGALGAVNPGKQQRISKAALYYLMEKGYRDDTPCRFDVVGITPKEIQLIKNAFKFRG